MFGGKKIDARAEARKMAALCVAWGVMAGVAYLGLVSLLVQLIHTAAPEWTTPTIDSGLIKLASSNSGLFKLTGIYETLATYVIYALPITIVGLLALGIAARVWPAKPALPVLLILAGLLGLIGALLLFVTVVATAGNGVNFLVALATIVLVSVLVRLQRFIRRFYGRSPTAATLLLAFLTIFYFLLSNGTSIASVMLQQIDVWLAIVAFAIAFYASLRLARMGRLMRRGAAKVAVKSAR
ncbi:MAG: hypothetical protein ABI068_16655 [Ktedonobacterales bacterium]